MKKNKTSLIPCKVFKQASLMKPIENLELYIRNPYKNNKIKKGTKDNEN